MVARSSRATFPVCTSGALFPEKATVAQMMPPTTTRATIRMMSFFFIDVSNAGLLCAHADILRLAVDAGCWGAEKDYTFDPRQLTRELRVRGGRRRRAFFSG